MPTGSTFSKSTSVASCTPARPAVPAMRANGGGTILATFSAASFATYHSIAMYSATKAGVNGLVRGLSLDLGRFLSTEWSVRP